MNSDERKLGGKAKGRRASWRVSQGTRRRPARRLRDNWRTTGSPT